MLDFDDIIDGNQMNINPLEICAVREAFEEAGLLLF